MNQRMAVDDDRTASTGEEAGRSENTLRPSRRFFLTDMPAGLMLGLVAVGLPRTILADLDIVAPESGLLYYALALAPFAAWLLAAILRESRRPFRDFLVLGIVYGLSLIVVHQALWAAPAGYGQRPPASAVNFAEQFDPEWYGLALRAHTSSIAMLIGVGTGLVAAIVAVSAHAWRARRAE